MEKAMKALMRIFLALHVFIYRLTGGKVMGKIGPGSVLLLTTIGRKSGETRTTPVTYFRDGADYVIVASAGGGPKNPGWYYNLKANPHTNIQVMDKVISVNAQETNGTERERLWKTLVSQYPQFNGYAQKAGRVIPLMLLHAR